MKEFRYVGTHAETLDNGRPIEPGEFTGPINERATKNKQLVDDGLLLEVADGTAEAEPEPSEETSNDQEGGDAR